MRTNNSGFACMECGHKFKTVKAAERAANHGCPKCGGVDVDMEVTATCSSDFAKFFDESGVLQRAGLLKVTS